VIVGGTGGREGQAEIGLKTVPPASPMRFSGERVFHPTRSQGASAGAEYIATIGGGVGLRRRCCAVAQEGEHVDGLKPVTHGIIRR
jgi:hypothetical protein